MAPLQRLQLAWAQARLKPKLEHGPFVGAAELLTIGTARLLATGEAGRAAGWAVEVVGYTSSSNALVLTPATLAHEADKQTAA
ncbi:hypothetical protein INP81_08330 [Comamonas thiooxydans]|uniref:hypothetical protein n=1 Tax=Comamonas thiooxydans TaxID=363952 RepID=UPI0018A4E29F|nr:hypothetical protein [Comamonas thiooxydans]QOQ83826.1 hypothetical protein INP81_08330 [Comamonas thiooxydans]